MTRATREMSPTPTLIGLSTSPAVVAASPFFTHCRRPKALRGEVNALRNLLAPGSGSAMMHPSGGLGFNDASMLPLGSMMAHRHPHGDGGASASDGRNGAVNAGGMD